MPKVIDYDRGVIIQSHPTLGVDVYMYVDDPGVYLTANGAKISEKLAKEAGFNVEDYGREKKRRAMMAAAEAQIAEELESNKPRRKVVREKGGLSIIDIGLGRHNVEDSTGMVLNREPIPREMANHLLDSMVGEGEGKPVTKPVTEPTPAGKGGQKPVPMPGPNLYPLGRDKG